MILTCPECRTRYQADATRFPPAGRDVRCARCGYVWHQNPPEPAMAEYEPAMPPPPPPPPPDPRGYSEMPMRHDQPEWSYDEPPQAETYSHAVEREPEPQRGAMPRQRAGWPRRLALSMGWIVLIVLVVAIGAGAALYRQQIAVYWPPTASLYSKLGMKVNPTGLQFDHVRYNEDTQNGQTVLTVSGALVNITDRELPVPQIRVGLSDNNRRELYHWTFAADVMTLQPGKSTRFVTRLSNPPPAARHLDVRFAKTGE